MKFAKCVGTITIICAPANKTFLLQRGSGVLIQRKRFQPPTITTCLDLRIRLHRPIFVTHTPTREERRRETKQQRNRAPHYSPRGGRFCVVPAPLCHELQ